MARCAAAIDIFRHIRMPKTAARQQQ